MASLTQEMLDRQPEETARLLAFSFLEEAEQALARLEDPEDREALHDFRVGLRRLRSSMRAYRRHLKGSVSKKLVNRVADLAASTGAGRDAEVLVSWLHSVEPLLLPEHGAGFRWLLERLEARKEQAYREVSTGAVRRFRKLKDDLTERLAVYRQRVETGPSSGRSTFGQVTGELLLEHTEALRLALDAVHNLEDEKETHNARIRGKRLRYLLEPLRDAVKEARAPVKRLKRLQDILGDLHDLSVLSAEIAAALEVTATERARRLHELALHSMVNGTQVRAVEDPDETTGLLGLVELVREHRNRLFEDLQNEWLGPRGDSFFEAVRVLGRTLRGTGVQGIEIERKYLLSALPDRLREVPGVWISQGWLPGKSINERIRRVRTPAGERHYRTIKIGTNLSRIEIEEQITRSLFRSLWPLTEGCRIRKRRYAVEEGAFTWEIDDFADMKLVMAEVELPSEEVEVEPPEWLAPWITEEVTGRREYQNLYLARHGHPRPAKRRR